jgi:hypothetical protein
MFWNSFFFNHLASSFTCNFENISVIRIHFVLSDFPFLLYVFHVRCVKGSNQASIRRNTHPRFFWAVRWAWLPAASSLKAHISLGLPVLLFLQSGSLDRYCLFSGCTSDTVKLFAYIWLCKLEMTFSFLHQLYFNVFHWCLHAGLRWVEGRLIEVY